MAPERRPVSPTAAEPLVQGVDYYLDASGLTVFTAHYNRRRGYCCFQGCRHCPWGQAGRSPTEAQADLQGRLRALEHALREAGVPARVRGYDLGVLRVELDGRYDVEQAERAVLAHAQGRLTILALAWG